MKTSDFDYYLPPELIAQTPVEPRDQSRLMVLNRSDGSIEHRQFSDITDYLDDIGIDHRGWIDAGLAIDANEVDQ